MKAIQITVDDELLARLDADPEVKSLGRSAVFRKAVATYLRDRRRRSVAAAYRKAYGAGKEPSAELTGWSDEGVWPDR